MTALAGRCYGIVNELVLGGQVGGKGVKQVLSSYYVLVSSEIRLSASGQCKTSAKRPAY